MNMASSQHRAAVFIDGSNFYFKLKSMDIKNISKFDFAKFSEWLARDRAIRYKGYYVGVVHAPAGDEKAQKLRLAQRQLFNHLLLPAQQFVLKKGYIIGHEGMYHEKGVDVQLAVDLVVGAYENTYDTAIIVSSDTDLIPAMRKAKELGKQIEYIGFAHQPSFALERYATLSRLLIKDEIVPFEFKTG